MDQTVESKRPQAAVPQSDSPAPGQLRREAPRSLSPVLQAIRAGLPVRTLPPATLAELAAYLGNSAMAALVELEHAGPALTRPRLGLPLEGPAWEADPAPPALVRPPTLAGLPPLSGPAGELALPGHAGDGAVWPGSEGGGFL